MVLASICAFSQVSIQMENDGGVYKIPCVVNGVKMKFIFDTGASKVCMSQSMAQFLLDGEYLSYDDIKGVGQSIVADGTIVNHALIILRDIEIAGMHLHDIEATVIEGQNAPLLLGQSAIQELGRITIDGNVLIIHNVEDNLTIEEALSLIDKAYSYVLEEKYDLAINTFIRANDVIEIADVDCVIWAYCYIKINDWDECIVFCKKWIKSFEKTAANEDKASIYDYLAMSYYFKHDYNNAVIWFQKELSIQESDNLFFYAHSLDQINRHREAIIEYKKAIKYECNEMGITIYDVEFNRVNDRVDLSRLGLFLRAYSVACASIEDFEKANKLMVLAAKCGDKKAIQFCNENFIDYKTKTSDLFE